MEKGLRLLVALGMCATALSVRGLANPWNATICATPAGANLLAELVELAKRHEGDGVVTLSPILLNAYPQLARLLADASLRSEGGELILDPAVLLPEEVEAMRAVVGDSCWVISDVQAS